MPTSDGIVFGAKEFLDSISEQQTHLETIAEMFAEFMPDILDIEYDEMTEEDQRRWNAYNWLFDMHTKYVDTAAVTLHTLGYDFGLDIDRLHDGSQE